MPKEVDATGSSDVAVVIESDLVPQSGVPEALADAVFDERAARVQAVTLDHPRPQPALVPLAQVGPIL